MSGLYPFLNQKRIPTHFVLNKKMKIKGVFFLCMKIYYPVLRYVKTETRSDATSTTTPSTQTQVAFAQTLKKN